VGGLTPSIVDAVRKVEVFNLQDATGGGDEESLSEIKANAASYFAAQDRAVTKEDFVAHILSMPPRFGRPEKVYVKHSDISPNGIDIHIITVDSEGKFSHPTQSLQQNVKTYLKKLRMLTQGITILSSNIINLTMTFGVVVSPKFNRSEVLTNCIVELKSYFSNDNMQIGMPIVLSDARSRLQQVPGVISVYKLDVALRRAGDYQNDSSFDVRANTKNDIIYCPQNSIFEVRYPDNDIVGESK
jgi:hypothetical protein